MKQRHARKRMQCAMRHSVRKTMAFLRFTRPSQAVRQAYASAMLPTPLIDRNDVEAATAWADSFQNPMHRHFAHQLVRLLIGNRP